LEVAFSRGQHFSGDSHLRLRIPQGCFQEKLLELGERHGQAMDKFLQQRRQMLLYLGLGAAGAIAFPALGMRSRQGRVDVAQAPPAAEESLIAALPRATLPEFQGISQWLNSPPLTLADLKNQVVLIQFWTFACINCQRTLPYIVQWHQRYANKGLRVIGVHTPEFAFERETRNIQQALKRYQITYPVPVDNEYKTWSAYSNQYWPHLFLADRQGKLRYDHIGEGAYEQTEQKIRQLLG
jgi:thiol-disulfide isomerase/thioredoxin